MNMRVEKLEKFEQVNQLTRMNNCRPCIKMLLITTALMIEAQPLKAVLGLTAVAGEPYPLFKNDQVLLIVTGTGAQRSAGATGWALGRFPSVTTALNLGYAAASVDAAELYQWYCVDSIRDESTGRLHIPDRLWKMPFPEKPLLTVGKPVANRIPWDGLVDMEASGFYEAARKVLPPDRILLFKWISDHLSGEIDPVTAGERFTAAIQELVPTMDKLLLSVGRATPDDLPLFDEIQKRIRLTTTQKQFLRKWLDGFLRRGGSAKSLLALLPPAPPPQKADNKRIFKELKHVLKG